MRIVEVLDRIRVGLEWVCVELGVDDEPPEWFDEPAVGRLTVTSPHDLAAFKTYNRGRPYSDQVKPWNFLAMAHPTDRERGRDGGPRSLVATFERDPGKRRSVNWADRSNAALAARPIRTDRQDFVLGDSFAVMSYGDYFDLP